MTFDKKSPIGPNINIFLLEIFFSLRRRRRFASNIIKMTAFDINNLPASEDEIDYSDIEAKYQVPFEEGFDNLIVVDKVPIVEESKKDKLFRTMRKIFRTAGVGEIKEGGISMPMDLNAETGKLASKG